MCSRRGRACSALLQIRESKPPLHPFCNRKGISKPKTRHHLKLQSPKELERRKLTSFRITPACNNRERKSNDSVRSSIRQHACHSNFYADRPPCRKSPEQATPSTSLHHYRYCSVHLFVPLSDRYLQPGSLRHVTSGIHCIRRLYRFVKGIALPIVPLE